MTVGIGVLCDRGETAVLASDLRATYPGSGVDPNEVTGKQWDFDVPFPVVACVAGNLGSCQAVVGELNDRLAKLARWKSPIHFEHVENAIREARGRTFRRSVDWALRTSYCLTLREWQRGKVPGGAIDPFIHNAVRALIDGHPLPAELIVAGFLPSGTILFFKGSGKKLVEASATPGNYVIGSGGALALTHLNRRGQNIDCSLPRTLLHLSEAMDEARKVPDRSVGLPQAFLIARSTGSLQRVEATASMLSDWKAVYRDRASTASLDGSQLAAAQVMNVLQKHR